MVDVAPVLAYGHGVDAVPPVAKLGELAGNLLLVVRADPARALVGFRSQDAREEVPDTDRWMRHLAA